MEDRENERPLFIEPTGLGAMVGQDGQSVWLRIGKPHATLGFEPDIVLAMSLSPSEARHLAQALTETARKAEAGQTPHLPSNRVHGTVFLV